MLPSNKRTKWLTLIYYSTLFLAFLLQGLPAYAQVPSSNTGTGTTPLSAVDMLTNFANNIPNLMRLVTAGAYVMGMYFVIMGVVKMKHMGEMRTQMSQEHSIKGPLIFITVY